MNKNAYSTIDLSARRSAQMGVNEKDGREQMMRKNNRTGKRLRLTPLILGGYAAFLGFGLIVIGLAEMKEGIGIVRLLIGLGMTCFGLLGIWDGVRDLVGPHKKAEQTPASQFILTDTSGNRSSLITSEVLWEQIGILAESDDPKSFLIKILPPLSVEEYGLLKHVFCIYHGNIILVALFEMPKDGYQIYQKSTEPDIAVEWLKQLLAGKPDFFGWDNVKTKKQQNENLAAPNKDDTEWDDEDTYSDEIDTPQESIESFWQQLQREQKGQMRNWRQLLVIFGESWHDEHTFFSARDVELAIDGIHEGKYTKVFLEWGTQALDFFPGVQNDLMVIWCTNNTGKGNTRFLAKEGTVTQVKFWLVNYLKSGIFEEMSGWADITDQIEKANRKGKKKHG